MKLSFFIFISLILIACGSSENVENKTLLSKKNSLQIDYDTVRSECVCVDTNRVKDNSHIFPFDKCKKVIIYSLYRSFPDTFESYYPVYKNLVANGKYIKPKTQQTTSLNLAQINSLEKILFNKVRKCNEGRINSACDCTYIPSHTIVFYDKNDSAYAFLELDLGQDETDGMYMKESELDLGALCFDVFCDLKNFLIEVGCKKNLISTSVCDSYDK